MRNETEEKKRSSKEEKDEQKMPKHEHFEAIKQMMTDSNLRDQCLALEKVLSDVVTPDTAIYKKHEENNYHENDNINSLTAFYLVMRFGLFNQDASSYFRDIPELINARNAIKEIATDKKTSTQDRAAAYHLLYLLESNFFGGSIGCANGTWGEFFYNNTYETLSKYYARKSAENYESLLKDSNFANGPLASLAYLNLARIYIVFRTRENNVENLNRYSELYVKALTISSAQGSFNEASKKEILAEWIMKFLIYPPSQRSYAERLKRWGRAQIITDHSYSLGRLGDEDISKLSDVIKTHYLRPNFFNVTKTEREDLLASVLKEKQKGLNDLADLKGLSRDTFSQQLFDQLLKHLKLAPESTVERDYVDDCSI